MGTLWVGTARPRQGEKFKWVDEVGFVNGKDLKKPKSVTIPRTYTIVSEKQMVLETTRGRIASRMLV